MAYDISSWDKPAGPESNEDLDRRAMRLLPDWAREVVREVALRHKVPVRDIFGASRQRSIVAARHEAIYRVKFEKPALSSGQLGLWFNRDHSSVLFALVRFQELTGAPVLSVRRQPTRPRTRRRAA